MLVSSAPLFDPPKSSAAWQLSNWSLQGASPAQAGGARPTLRWRGAGKVLVVDDEEAIRRTAGRVLGTSGFEVLLAADGPDGISTFARQPQEIALVLLDLTMPRMSGEQTFLRLRALRSDVPILLMSGLEEQDAVQRFGGLGLAGFVHKPFGVEELRSAVRSLLG